MEGEIYKRTIKIFLYTNGSKATRTTLEAFFIFNSASILMRRVL